MTQLCDIQSSSNPSSHEIAPKLHVSPGGVEDSEMRESGSKKPRVDTDMEISATETLTNAKLEVDRALDRANKTLQRLLEEIPLARVLAWLGRGKHEGDGNFGDHVLCVA